jgi:hypothetical protein
MGLGKLFISFLLVALFATTAIGMAAIMDHDKPTDSYYTMPNNTATGSVALSGTIFSTMGSLGTPLIFVAGILVLLGGFMILRKG